VRFELGNAPRLGFEHLLRFLATARQRVMSSLAVRGFVRSHHASDSNIGRMRAKWPHQGVFVLTSVRSVLSGL
jgi:hypothetical protein